MSGRLGTDVRFLETLFRAGTTCGLTDAQLVERFVSRHDETAGPAFESLVLRHGPMVFDTCLKILGNVDDAHDAFQATFLILATRAKSIMRQGSVASWLHGVALRVARRARADAAKRKVHEREVAEMTPCEAGSSTSDSCHDFEALHEEVERLPHKYRQAVVLCYFEGMTLDAAAGHLGWPIGTLGVRLMRARERLKAKLGRREMSVPAGVLVAGLSARSASAALPAALVGATVNAAIGHAASGVVSLAAARFAHEVLRSMVMIKLAKISTALLVAMAAAGSLGGILVHSGKLIARESRNETPNQTPASWIGKKVVTKYSAPVKVGNQVADSDGIFRVYTVQEVDGNQVRLMSESVNGWIRSSEIVLVDEAIDFYTKELLANPDNAEAYSQRALIWLFQRENEKALADFTDSIRLDPRRAHVYVNRGNVFHEKREYDKAIADYSEAVRLVRGFGDAYRQRGVAWYDKGSYEKAIDDLTEALRLEPKDSYAYSMRGDAWSNKNEYDKAIADYTEAIRLDSKYVWAYGYRGLAWFNKKEYNKAIADYTEAIRLDPKDLSAHVNRGDAWSELKEYDKAITDFTEAIRIDPNDLNAYDQRGLAWFKKQDYNKAIADFTEVIRLDPKLFRAYLERGDAWSEKREYDKAIADYTEAIRIDSRSLLAFENRGLVWSDKEEYDKAIADFTEAIRLDPRDLNAYGNRGNARFNKKEYDKAIADYTEAIRLDPRDARTYGNRGSAWSHKKEYDKAIADCAEAIRLDPRDALAHRIRGIAWLNKQEYDKAIADCNEAIRIEPERPDAYNGRAWIWATCPDEKFRDGKKSVESATKACELTKWNEADYLGTLAAACAEVGNFESAVKWQTKANALYADPGDRSRGEARLKLYQEKKPYRDAGP